MQDYEFMLKAYSQAGGNPEVFKNSKIAHLVIHKNKVIGKHTIEGLILKPKETERGVDVYLEVIKRLKIDNTVHICFGVLPKEGEQIINIKTKINDEAGISLLAHCVFPEALNVVHKMQAEIEIGEDAFYEYNEVHFHGEGGGITVLPAAKIKVGNNSRFASSFSLLKGRVGKDNWQKLPLCHKEEENLDIMLTCDGAASVGQVGHEVAVKLTRERE